MKSFYVITLLLVLASSTCITNKKSPTFQTEKTNEIICTDVSCSGKFIGREFVNGSDIAHQFSNKMAEAVGDKLKELYHTEKFSKVDFEKIISGLKGK